jgi:hypothetical protein
MPAGRRDLHRQRSRHPHHRRHRRHAALLGVERAAIPAPSSRRLRTARRWKHARLQAGARRLPRGRALPDLGAGLRLPGSGPACRIPTSLSATAMSIASMARARRSSARPMTSSRMRSSRSTRWTRHAASSIRTRSPCSKGRAKPARPRSLACSTAARAKASRSFRVSSCSSHWAAAARRCCCTSAMRRACAPMSAPIAQTASWASA